MSEARAFAHRVPVLPLLLFSLAQVGCAPAPRAVRLRTAEGQVRVTTPPPRAPMVLPKEEIHRAVRALAQKIVPVADPLEFARERFEVPVREGVYILNARTKELKPADRATEAIEELSPELLEQARKYLQWCANRHQPGDCLGVLHGRRTLDAHGRYAVAMGIAIAGTLEATKDSLEDMVSVKEVLGMVVAGVTMYAVLWVLPEPTSKGIAAAITIVLVGWIGVHTLYTLGLGFEDLSESSEKATTFEALREEGEKFARVMGADSAQILVMVATAAMGSELGQGMSRLSKLLPNLPGAAQASELAVQEGAVAFEQLGAVESVTIGKGGLTISLVNGTVLATSLSDSFRPGPRINLYRPPPGPKSIPERVQALKDAGVKGDLDKLMARIGKDPGAIGELEAVERWLSQGIDGKEIEILERSTVEGQKSPDFRVKGELTEIKTRSAALNRDYVYDQVRAANEQMQDSGLDGQRPMVGVDGFGPQGQLEIQLQGDAARTGTLDLIEGQVRKAFNGTRGFNLRRVAVYGDGQLLGEWIRTTTKEIVRLFPPR